MGYDPIWLALMFAINLQTSFLTPPFGFALFYLRGVAPKEIKTVDDLKGMKMRFFGLGAKVMEKIKLELEKLLK